MFLLVVVAFLATVVDCSNVVPSNNLEGEICDMCETIVKWVETFLSQNKTEEDIESAMELVCKVLPKADRDLCNLLIEEYIPVFVNYLKQEDPPEHACEAVHLCSEKEENASERRK